MIVLNLFPRLWRGETVRLVVHDDGRFEIWGERDRRPTLVGQGRGSWRRDGVSVVLETPEGEEVLPPAAGCGCGSVLRRWPYR